MININTSDYWDKKHIEFYDNRYIDVMGRIYHNFILDRILANKKVIDIGCGKGLFIEDLIKNRKCETIWGVDFSEKVIKLNEKYFKQYGNNIIFVNYDIRKPVKDFFSFQYDYVICMEVLEHIEDYMNLMNKLNYLCKKDGKIFIIVPNKSAIVSNEHVNCFSSQIMMDMIKKVGINIEYKRMFKPTGKSVRNLAFCYNPLKEGVL